MNILTKKQDLRDLRVILAKKVRLVIKGLEETEVTKGLMEIKVIVERKEAEVPKEIMEIEDTKVPKVIKVIRERKVKKEMQVRLASKDQKERQVMMVQLERKEHKVIEV